MDSSFFFGITTVAFLLSAVGFLALLIFRQPWLRTLGLVFAATGVLTETLALGLRWYESYQLGYGHAPLTNMYESLVFFAWSATLVFLFFDHRFRVPVLGVLVMPLAFLSMAYASLLRGAGQEITPLLPALQSNWLISHVITCFISYAAFAVAAALAVLYLIRHYLLDPTGPKPKTMLPALTLLDDLIHKSIVFGFIWLSIGIITGAVWANEAWGTYWAWDAKEVWSVITWLVYAFTLHLRFAIGWTGTRIAWLALLGLVAVFFTYIGVNLWLPGLHSYGSVG